MHYQSFIHLQSLLIWTFTLEKSGRKWKYNEKIEQHYVEIDESGELTKKYTQTKEEEEVRSSDAPVTFQDVSLDDPNAIERGSESEATVKAPGTQSRPQAAVENQDCSIITTHEILLCDTDLLACSYVYYLVGVRNRTN